MSGDRSYLPDLLISLLTSAPLVAVALAALLAAPLVRRRHSASWLWAGTAILHFWFSYHLVVGGDETVFGAWISRFYGIVALFAAGGALALTQLTSIRVQALLVFVGLSITLWQAPRSLRAADARHDQVGWWQAVTLLSAASEGAVIIAEGDRLAMALHYAQRVARLFPERCVIVRALYTSASYRQALPSSCGGFQVEPDLAKGIRRVLERSVLVLSSADAIPPTGIFSRLDGGIWRWSLQQEAPSLRAMAQFCAEIPDDLRELPPERLASYDLAGLFYGHPILALEELAMNDAQKMIAQQVAKAYAAGNLPLVRHRCRTLFRE